MKLISAVRSLLLLLCCTTATIRADFTLTLSVTGHSTSGNCFGDDLTGPCETFLSIFCLRDPRQTSSTSTSDCPLGVNHQQIGPDRNSGVRTISSTQPWPGAFQMFIRAFDDDDGVSSPDHLDNIFINENLVADRGYNALRTFSGSRVTINMQFRVDCAANFFSPDCTVFCVRQADDVNGHFTCDPTDGSRVCLPDFYGPECLTFCLAANDDTNGFFTCNPSDGSRICREGYTNPEDLCRENIDDCVSSPCQNKGNCTDLVADFECACPPGYTDKTCSTDIDECLTANCPTNSTCVENEVNSFVCECHAGFEGENCTEIRPCDSVTCENGGTCVSDDPFSFQCVCAAGYNGSTCQQDIDECLEAVCPEDSTCVDQVDGYMCSFNVNDNGGNDDPFSGPEEAQIDKKIVIVGCVVGGVVIILMLLFIVIISVLLGRRKMKHYSAGERSGSHIYHPAPVLAGISKSPSLTKDQLAANALEDTMDFNTLYNGGPSPFSPVSNAAFSLNGEVRSEDNRPEAVVYEQIASANHEVAKLVSAGASTAGSDELCSNVAYGIVVGNQSINNPLYSTTSVRAPPIYSVPRPAQEHADSAIQNNYASVLTDRASSGTSSPDSNQPLTSPNQQSRPAFYESIKLVSKEDRKQDLENVDPPQHYAVPATAVSVCEGGEVAEGTVEDMRYSKLKHLDDAAPEAPRLATIPDSGYEALKKES